MTDEEILKTPLPEPVGNELLVSKKLRPPKAIRLRKVVSTFS